MERKVFIYSYRPDEAPYFDDCCKEFDLTIAYDPEPLTDQNWQLCKGYPCVSINAIEVNAQLLKRMYDNGVRFITTRSIGFDHIDLQAAHDLGIRVSNLNYSAHSVADYAVMLILMVLRHAKTALGRTLWQDYSLTGLSGREIHNLTIGVVGTGQIGQTVIQNLQGFSPRILAYDLYPNERTAKLAQYVDFATLLRESDVITLHCPLTDDNYHMFNSEAFCQMKPGAVLVNTARGPLVDTQALLNALETGKLGGCALDVLEGEMGYFFHDCKERQVNIPGLRQLLATPNAIVTPHLAFYTDQTTLDKARLSMLTCKQFLDNEPIQWEK